MSVHFPPESLFSFTGIRNKIRIWNVASKRHPSAAQMRIYPAYLTRRTRKMRNGVVEQPIRLTTGIWVNLHSVLGNCSMRCPSSCVPAVVSGFWNNLAAHLARSPLNHSYGYDSAGDHPTATHREVGSAESPGSGIRSLPACPKIPDPGEICGLGKNSGLKYAIPVYFLLIEKPDSHIDPLDRGLFWTIFP